MKKTNNKITTNFSVDKLVVEKFREFADENGLAYSIVVEECLKDLLNMKSLVEKWKGVN